MLCRGLSPVWGVSALPFPVWGVSAFSSGHGGRWLRIHGDAARGSTPVLRTPTLATRGYVGQGRTWAG